MRGMYLFTVEFSLWSALFIWLNPSQHSRQVALDRQDHGQLLLCLPSIILSSCILTTGSGKAVYSLYWYICRKCTFEVALTPVFFLLWCLGSTVCELCFSWMSSVMGPQMSSVSLPSESPNWVSPKISIVRFWSRQVILIPFIADDVDLKSHIILNKCWYFS